MVLFALVLGDKVRQRVPVRFRSRAVTSVQDTILHMTPCHAHLRLLVMVTDRVERVVRRPLRMCLTVSMQLLSGVVMDAL